MRYISMSLESIGMDEHTTIAVTGKICCEEEAGAV